MVLSSKLNAQSQERSKTRFRRLKQGDFPGGPVVKNLPCNAGDSSLIPVRGAEIPHALGQLSSSTTTTDPMSKIPTQPSK